VDGILAECWDWKAAKQPFSKKHVRCGHNVQVVSDSRGRLREVGAPLPGARHGAYAYVVSGIKAKIQKYRHRLGDKGCQGSNQLAPYKKPPRHRLTEAEKTSNRAHSQICSAIERCIGHLENWKLLGGCYRSPLYRLP
jgi:hypothetical protein